MDTVTDTCTLLTTAIENMWAPDDVSPRASVLGNALVVAAPPDVLDQIEDLLATLRAAPRAIELLEQKAGPARASPATDPAPATTMGTP